MTTDQASADYAYEQERREAQHDNRAYWHETKPPRTAFVPDQCSQCINWQPDRLLHLADGTTQCSPGFCTIRAAADLEQMPQDYAAKCLLYEEDIPF